MFIKYITILPSLASVDIVHSTYVTYREWTMSREVIEGNIVMYFVKPVDMMLYKLFQCIGYVLLKFVTTTIPTVLVILLVFKPDMPIGLNLLIFPVSIILSYLIMFNIDFLVGLICFYNESTWGMSSAKDSVVLLLSGAVIPINFFPETLKTIVNFLPFQAVYNIPLNTLISDKLGAGDYIKNLIVQIFWILFLFAINRLFYRKAVKVVTVNGG